MTSAPSTSTSLALARITPITVTCPGITDGMWNGSLRAQTIVRLFARWCLSQPLQLSTHINVVLIDALVDAKGYISADRLTRQLGLLFPGQVTETLTKGACAPVVCSRVEMPETVLGGGGDDGGGDTSSSAAQQLQQLQQVGEKQYAIDYRRALPHAYTSMLYYFSLVLSESVLTSTLPERVRNTVTYNTSRVLPCAACSQIVAWAEVEAPVLSCPQCFSSLVIGILKALLAVAAAQSDQQQQQQGNNSSSNNDATRRTTAAAVTSQQQPVAVVRRIWDRLRLQRCLNPVIEQAALFLELFKSKFVLVARVGASVVHPDRVFGSEEFASMMNAGSGSGGGGGDNDEVGAGGGGVAVAAANIGVMAATRPRFVEPGGVIDGWLPGLRIASAVRRVKRSGDAGENDEDDDATQNDHHHHHHHHHHSHAAFPPWLRDDVPPAAEEGLPQHNMGYRDLTHSSGSSTSSSSSSSSSVVSSDRDDDDDDDADGHQTSLVRRHHGGQYRQERSRELREAEQRRQALLLKKQKEEQRFSELTTQWQAVHAAAREDAKKRLQQQQQQRRRQRDDDDDDDEWERIL